MDLIDKINELALKVKTQKGKDKTEEATKVAFINPFIRALEYDVSNPEEVIPECVADIAAKQGEKVDYAIKKDGEIIFIMECKHSGIDLQQNHAEQLYRYFQNSPTTKFSILTNGVIYQFFNSSRKDNSSIPTPFFTFNILDFQDFQITELKKFTKSAFSAETISESASRLKYTNAIKKILVDELENPSELFIRFFAKRIYQGKITKNVVNDFKKIVREAHNQFITERVEELTKQLQKQVQEKKKLERGAHESTENVDDLEVNDRVVITDEELVGYNIAKAILCKTVDVNRVVMREARGYLAILLDDNNRKPICRLYVKGSQKYIGVFSHKKEQKHEIDSLDKIYDYSEEIRSTVSEY